MDGCDVNQDLSRFVGDRCYSLGRVAILFANVGIGNLERICRRLFNFPSSKGQSGPWCQ